MTDQRFVADLNSLESRRRASGRLLELNRRGLIKGQRRVAEYKAPATGGGGGIASPLTEKTKSDGNGGQVADRTYYAGGLPTSDGLLMLPLEKQMKFTDADGAEVIINYASPVAQP